MKVKITTYRISLTNNNGEKQILNFFNGEDDFLNIAHNFCSYIFQNRRNYTDNTGNLRTFTLGYSPSLMSEQRCINGYFDSAYTGDVVDIKESTSNDVLYHVTRDKLQSKKFFFFISVPKNSKYAYLVVQRKANHGVKSILETSFSHYLRFLGYDDYRVHIEDAPSYYLLETMLQHGRLKEVKLINKTLMSSFDEQFANEGVVNVGSFDKVLKFGNNARTQMFKTILFQLYRANYSEYQQVHIAHENFDEVSFTIELDDLSKTFYVKDKSKIRSNIDITNLVEIVDEEPTHDSMIQISLDIITRLIQRNENGEQDAA